MNLNKTTRIGFLLCLAFVSLMLSAQNKNVRFQHLTIESGLPQNFIDCIYQDRNGFIWVGTWSGLARYDGYNFDVFRQDTKDNSTISNNYVYSVCEGKEGNLYLATAGGLNIYLYNQSRFYRFADYPDLHPDLSETTTAVAVGQDSVIWVGGEKGLIGLSFDEQGMVKNKETYFLGDSLSQVHGSVINHILVTHNGDVWVSTDNGISVLHHRNKSFSYLNANKPFTIPFNSVKSTFEASDSHVWIATEFGIADFNPADSTFIIYNHNPYASPETGLIYHYAMSVSEDVNGNILVGTFGGFSIIHKNDGVVTFENYKENALSEYSLNNDFVNCVFRDRDNNIWIGTERGGINRYNSSKNVFEYYEHIPGNPHTISSNIINSIYDDEVNTWIGTAGGGLNVLNKESGQLRNYTLNLNDHSGKSLNNFISEIHRDTKNNLWVGTWGGGLFKLVNENTEQESFVNFRPSIDTTSLVNVFISSIISDDSGNLWIGTYEGLDFFNVETNQFEHIRNAKGHKRIRQIGSLLLDSDKNLWVGTRNGLYKVVFDKKGKYSVKEFQHDPNLSNSLSDNYVTTLFMDAEGAVYAGTYGFGINKLISEESGGLFEKIGVEDGLANNTIYCILDDNKGNLWITTDNGLSCYNPETSRFKNYYVSDGLQNNQYYWNAAFKNEEGKIFVGGVNGLNTFYPDSVFSHQGLQSSKVLITDFKIYSQSIAPQQKVFKKVVLDKPVIFSDDITVSYKAKEISFEFAQLNYDQPESVLYAYMLEGFDTKWNEISSNRRFASFTNLKPGRYVFKVKATRSDGDWSSDITSINLNIKPPFWKTFLFRLFIVTLALILLIVYNRYKVVSLRKRQKLLEDQVAERTLEIEKQKETLSKQNEHINKQRDDLIELNEQVKAVNESKLRFFTNISHEFRTPLTLILGPLEYLTKDESLSENAHSNVDKIENNAHRLLTLINQLMDFRKLEHGKMQLQISANSLNTFMYQVISAFKPLAEMKQIAIGLKCPEEEAETWFDRVKLENVMYNLLSNAFKYTASGGAIDVRLSWSNSKKDVAQIEVSDTGMGISKEKLALVFDRFFQVEASHDGATGTGIGLSLTKEIIECHKGNVRVESTPGKGTVFTIELPVGKSFFTEAEISEGGGNKSDLKNQVMALRQQLSTQQLTDKEPVKLMDNKDGKKVLIVEDNTELRLFLADNLQNEYIVYHAENGVKGLKMAQKLDPDIVISDIMMPEKDGLELCADIKSDLSTSHIPVILLTAKSEIQDQVKGLETGADAYVSKPFNMSLLKATIGNQLNNRISLLKAFNLRQNIDVSGLATTPTDNDFLDKVLNIIKENFENSEFNVEQLAKKLMLSRGYLHKKLTALTGMTPVEFINSIKLKKACELLKEGKFSVSQVGYAVGYNDPKYFGRIFKKQFGQTPKEFQG